MSSTYSRETRRVGIPRAFAGVTRILGNLALAYVLAGVVSFVFIAVAELTSQSTGGAGLLGNWTYGMGWLSFGAPFLAIALALLDLALVLVLGAANRRRVALGVCLTPGALLALLVPFYPEIAFIVGWLLLVGLALGRTMRLPPFRPARPVVSPGS